MQHTCCWTIKEKLSLETTNQLTCYISPLCPGFRVDGKKAQRSKNSFRVAEVKKMHDLLTKNIYKIKHKVRQQRQQLVINVTRDT